MYEGGSLIRNGMLAIFDYELDYGNHLMNYINRKSKLSFQTSSFSNIDSLLEYAAENPIDILLIGEDAEKELDTLRDKAKNIYILTKGQEIEDSPYPCIYKFQSANQIVMNILEYYLEDGNNKMGLIKTTSNSKKVICTLSLDEKSKKNLVSLALSNYYGLSYKTLYVNLEFFSQLSFLKLEESPGFSELLYYIKQKNQNLMIKLNSMIHHCNHFDLIPPASHYQDLLEMTEEDIDFFLQCLLDYSDYDVIVFDVTYTGNNILSLFHFCDSIYITLENDFIARENRDTFYKQLREGKENEILNKIEEVIFSLDEKIITEDFDSLDTLLEGPIHDYVEGLLRTVV